MEFTAKIYKIGINPYVLVPRAILNEIFKQADKNKGPISISIIIAGHNFIQTLVKYSGKWRLYLNTPMRKVAGKNVGDIITLGVLYDSKERIVPQHPKFESALNKNKKAKDVFDKLPLYRQKEILRYINSLKTNDAIEKI
jgi:hypothetical protein